MSRPRIYRGPFGSASYQSIYAGPAHALDLGHQLGAPAAWLAVLTSPLALLQPAFGLLALAGFAVLGVLGAIDASRARPPKTLGGPAVGFRLGVALLHLLQPLARLWGRVSHTSRARRDLPAVARLQTWVRELPGGTLLLGDDRPRPELARAIASILRQAGLAVSSPTAWEGHDGRVAGSALVRGELLTSGHPAGSVQVRIRPRPRLGGAVVLASVLGVAAVTGHAAIPFLLALAGVDVALGWWRVGPKARRAIRDAAGAKAS
jgi:hypothetical protein